MTKLSLITIFICASSLLCGSVESVEMESESYRNKEQQYIMPKTYNIVKDVNSALEWPPESVVDNSGNDGNYDNTEELPTRFSESAPKSNVLNVPEPKAGLWSRILKYLDKARESFSRRDENPSSVSKSREANDNSPSEEDWLSKVKQYLKQSGYYSLTDTPLLQPGLTYQSDTGSQNGPETQDDGPKAELSSSKRSGTLSINGALTSLADMLLAESDRRDHEAILKLRQRLLVAGKR